jgi:hypothetical protein
MSRGWLAFHLVNRIDRQALAWLPQSRAIISRKKKKSKPHAEEGRLIGFPRDTSFKGRDGHDDDAIRALKQAQRVCDQPDIARRPAWLCVESCSGLKTGG